MIIRSPELGLDEKRRVDIVYNLRGKTLKVYLHLLSSGEPVGVREI